MKLVKESIYNFERKEDKLSSLGIGQKVLIEKWLNEMDIKNYIINDNYTIDVNGHVDLLFKNLVEFPKYIQFNKIDGYFDCSFNKLISLKGCPKIIYGFFACKNNQLESLEGCPKYVDGNFYCINNKVQFTVIYINSLCEVKGVYRNN